MAAGYGKQTMRDYFASAANTQLPLLWSKETVSAWSRRWHKVHLLLNAPFEDLSPVVARLLTDGTKAIVVVPEWRQMEW